MDTEEVVIPAEEVSAPIEEAVPAEAEAAADVEAA